MTTVISEVYTAFLSAGITQDKARAAAKAMADEQSATKGGIAKLDVWPGGGRRAERGAEMADAVTNELLFETLKSIQTEQLAARDRDGELLPHIETMIARIGQDQAAEKLETKP